MDIFEAIGKRYSCRAYQDRPVEAETLDKILEAARLAPSAKNLQDWRFVVVTDAAIRQRLCVAANNQPFVGEAPVVIAACCVVDYWMRCGQAIGPIDVSIALEHIALQATDLGLGTCWIGSFFPDQVRQILGIPTSASIIELMTLGYPAGPQGPRKRESLDSIVCHNHWKF
jgi:nitroreductase